MRKLADSLAVQLEQENAVVMQQIQQQKVNAEQRLALAARELERLRLAKATTTSASLAADKEEEMNKLKQQSDATAAAAAAAMKDSAYAFDPSQPEEQTYSVQSSPTKQGSAAYVYEQEETDGELEGQITQSTVKIALVESIMGNRIGGNDAVDEGFCIVEYDSD